MILSFDEKSDRILPYLLTLQSRACNPTTWLVSCCTRTTSLRSQARAYLWVSPVFASSSVWRKKLSSMLDSSAVSPSPIDARAQESVQRNNWLLVRFDPLSLSLSIRAEKVSLVNTDRSCRSCSRS